MDTIYKYFLREMAWLRSAGREFAEANPGLDTFLHSGGAVGDPHVDRILEGAAFLAARLDKRLDDSLLRVAEDILSLTYPELMEPQPSIAIAQFGARKTLKGPEVVLPGAQLLARSQRGNSRQVRLRVTDRVTAGNFKVSNVEPVTTPHLDRTAIRLTLSSLDGQPLAGKEPLPGQIPILLWWNDLAHSSIVRDCINRMPVPPRFFAGADGGEESPIESGLSLRVPRPLDYEPVFYCGHRAFPGFRMMREFFAMPQRFMRVEIVGLDTCEEMQTSGDLTVEITLPMAPRDLPPFETDNFLLFTTAVCNEWEGSAKPIHWDGTRETYPLEADYPGGAEILRVNGVRMLPRGADAFTEVGEFNYHDRDVPSYRARPQTYHLSESRRAVRWTLDVSNLGDSDQMVTVVTDLSLANADAHETLGARAALNNYEGIPEDLRATTVAPSTEFAPALEAEGQYWQLVNMVASHLSAIADPKRLQRFLLHLNRTGNKIIASAIRGIRGVDLHMSTTTLRQQPIKMASMTIDVDQGEYLNRGFMALFFEAAHSFLMQYVPLNCILEFEVRDVETGETLCRWRPEEASDGWR